MTTAELIKGRIDSLSPDQQQMILHVLDTIRSSVSAQRPVKSLYGLWAGVVDVCEVDIENMRREALKDFPRSNV